MKLKIEEGIYPKGTTFEIKDEFLGYIKLTIEDYKNKKYKLKVLRQGVKEGTIILPQSRVDYLATAQSIQQIGKNEIDISTLRYGLSGIEDKVENLRIALDYRLKDRLNDVNYTAIWALILSIASIVLSFILTCI